MRPLRYTLATIGLFQLVLGLLFVLAPAQANDLFRISPAEPRWVDWLFLMLGARFLGFAYGMFRAFRDPQAGVGWINAMIAIQAIDWIATVGHLIAGDVTIAQVSTAAFAPPLFILMLWRFHPTRVAPRLDASLTPRGAGGLGPAA